MTEEMSYPSPPQGIKAIPWRIPILFYRLGLGRLLGSRFLLLNHQGRISGKSRQAVLEIIQADPELGRYTVVSGFGPKSDWYRNIKKEPLVIIQVGTRDMQAVARQVDPEQAGEIITAYAQKYPRSLKTLARVLGYRIEHSPEGYRRFGQQLPVIQFSAVKQG